MNLRRALFIAACTTVAMGTAARAQQPMPPGQAGQQPPPCVQEFFKLRDDAQKKASAIRAANERKVPPKEACALFNTFAASEAKMIKYAVENQVWCGIPPEVIDSMKKGQAQGAGIRQKVCAAAAQPQRPAGPSLSDTLGGPVPNSSNIKTGRGTFDTLTGTPLGNR
ncbi:MAG: hypothetical protein ACK4UO_09225 [Pseudolabrys sp.]